MNFFKEIFFGEEKNFSSKAVLFNFMILSASVLFLYFFSYSTSPRYFFIGNDSIIFQTVGKCWAEGLLPYVGTFENKGPLLFLINALGYMIYPRYGIMLLQIPFMYFSFLFMWRAVELYWSRRATLIIFLFMIFWRASIFYEGNRTEEYSMPFLMAATYFFLRYLKEEKNFLPPFVGFIYGLGFGACVLLRTTNGLPICCYVLLTTIFLLQAGAFKNIWQNFLSFCKGFVIICLPFIIYFAAHGALYDMLYGTILLNIKHTTGFNPSTEEFYELMVPHIVLRCSSLIWMILISLFALFFNWKSRLNWSGLITTSAMFFMLIKSRPFGYPELIASLLPVSFAVLYSLKVNFLPKLKEIWSIRVISFKRTFCKAGILILLFIVLFQVSMQSLLLYSYFSYPNRDSFINSCKNLMSTLDKFQKNIPEDEKTSVICWGESNVVGHFLLVSGIKPRCRFFGNINDFFGKSDPAVIDEWLQNVQSDYPKWILYTVLEEEYLGKEMTCFKRNFQFQKNLKVEQILDERYILKDKMKLYDQIMMLYRLKE